MIEQIRPEASLDQLSPVRVEPFSPADLPILQDGRIYHLHLKPEFLASDILLVGDPGRALFIMKEFLEDVELAVEHRGLQSVTGTIRGGGGRISIVTSGMGTGSLEIAAIEISILKTIDFETRTTKGLAEPLQILRVGSSGGLQAGTPLGMPILTSYAIGMDNTGMFFDVPANDPEIERVERDLYEYLKNATPLEARFRGRIHPYVTKSDPGLLEALKQAARELDYPCIEGITVSNSGFFASQGRDVLSIPPTIPEIDRLFAEFDPKLGGLRLENCEMESSALFLIAGGQGFPTATICPAVANRRLETFLHDSESAVKRSTEIAIRALQLNRKRLSEIRCSE